MLLYAVFYLALLDANKLHLYVVFNPRTKAVVLTYPLLVLLYYAIYKLWKGWTAETVTWGAGASR